MKSLPGWQVSKEALRKDFVFKDFAEALGFLVEVGVHAETLNHHPEWTNVYNRVSVLLRTHDAGNTVTEKDFDLAGRMDAIAGRKQRA
jgi:4a-hydroxytetrahydrobiopterin dehydratase